LFSLISVLESTTVGLRSKALRGVGAVITVDPGVIAMPVVRRAIENRLSDSSPAVRDAALELVGKYAAQRPGLVEEYYPQIALRITVSAS
jgi:cohesin loading factor subunit SCC2